MTHAPTEPATLPIPDDADGAPRRVGVEVELGGLTESQVVHIGADLFGGEIDQTGAYTYTLRDSAIGDVEVMLDTAFRDHAGGALAKAGLDVGRAVIPVEFVTEPLLPQTLGDIDRFCDALAEAGATGTQDGMLLGFGMHLNIAAAGRRAEDILPVLRAFALAEDGLRARTPIDPSRRLLPFVDPYPPRLLDALAAPDSADWDAGQMIDAYLHHAPSRNYALDMLPLFRDLDSDRVTAAIKGSESIKPRPAYHYRLPDARVDDPDWSVSGEWATWCEIEALAAQPDAVERLAAAWRRYRDRLVPIPGRWSGLSAEILAEEEVLQ
ncbi:hypothetical protein DXV76_04570 [Rhodobacteraceae bacterium CCMM004]|nr:hypothetical protein DXV76_04570 [Rhodobacteraceae bacterium CCMM004]